MRDMIEPFPRERLDKWLWHARIVRARATAAALVESGHVRINGARVRQASHAVKPGDVLTVALDARVRLLRVEAFAKRRGDAPSARSLYIELSK